MLKNWNFEKIKNGDDREQEMKKDGSLNWLSSFCMYKLYELV